MIALTTLKHLVNGASKLTTTALQGLVEDLYEEVNRQCRQINQLREDLEVRRHLVQKKNEIIRELREENDDAHRRSLEHLKPHHIRGCVVDLCSGHSKEDVVGELERCSALDDEVVEHAVNLVKKAVDDTLMMANGEDH